jgi:hypothetical protein
MKRVICSECGMIITGPSHDCPAKRTKPCPRCGGPIGINVVAHWGCRPETQQEEPVTVGTLTPEEQGFRDHWAVLADAHHIHVDRTKVRGEQWRIEGLLKMATVAEDKARRMRLAIEQGLVPQVDDALDLINYGAFCARLIQDQTIVHKGEPS